VWDRDGAASGWRSRMLLSRGELFAYDDGRWEVRIYKPNVSDATGKESSAELAKKRALGVYVSLTTDFA
jgi:hypothetical protein